MNDTNFREAHTDDAGAIALLCGELGYPTSEAQARNRLASVLGSDRDCALVAVTSDGSVVGWIHIFLASRILSDRFAELGGFVVAADHRGRGIGTKLLAEAESWAVQRGALQFRIRSRSARTDAHRFYERLGFRRTKTQHVFDKSLDDTVND